MALADTAQLIVDLKLNDQLSSGVSRAEGELRGLNQTAGQTGTHTSRIAAGFGAASVAAGKLGGAMSHAKSAIGGLVSGPLGMIGLAGGAFGLEQALTGAVRSATDFQSAMELIRTQAGGTQAEVETMSEALKALAPTVATGPEALAASLYHVESAGLRGAQALDIVKTAAEGAKVGNADLESVTNALIASVTSGIGGVKSMGEAMGVLNAIVGSGNMRMQDLTDAFSTGILSSAKTFGVSIQSVGAALADMTNQGVPAQDAATRLRMTISLLGAPTSKAAGQLKSIGIGQLDLANAMRSPDGILAAVQLLSEHMQKAGLIDANGNVSSKGADLLSQAFGGGRSSSAIMTLIGSLGKLGDIQRQVTSGAGSFGDAWAATQQDAQFKFEKFGAAMGALGIEIGNALLPPLSDAADALSKFFSDNQSGIISGLKDTLHLAGMAGQALGTMLQPLIGAWGLVPEPLKALLVGGFVAQKASKWLFGSGPLDWGKSIAGSLLGRVTGSVPGLGSVVGATGAVGTPVYVTNWPAGGLGGSGLGAGAGGATGAAEAAGGLLAPGLAALVAGIATPFIMFNVIPQLVSAKGGNEKAPITRQLASGGSITVSGDQAGLLRGLMPSADRFAAEASGAPTAARAYGEHAIDRLTAITNKATSQQWNHYREEMRGFSSVTAAQRAAQNGISNHVDSLKPYLSDMVDYLRLLPATIEGLVKAGLPAPSYQYQPGGLSSPVVVGGGTSDRSNVIAHTRVTRFTTVRSSAI